MKNPRILQCSPFEKKCPGIQGIARVLGPVLACVIVNQPVYAEEDPYVGSARRPCTGRVTLYLDDAEVWNRDAEAMRKMKEVVTIPDGRQQGKKGILLAALIESVPDIQAVEVSTCNGKVRRFEGEKLQAKKDTLYLVITKYRGFKLFNSAGESGRGSRLKNIDQIRLIKRPE